MAGLAAKLAIDGTRAAGRAIASMPKPVLAIGAVGLIAALIHPTSRRWVFDRLEQATDITGLAIGRVYEVLLPVLDEHYIKKQSADNCLAAVTALLVDAGIAPADVLRQPAELPAAKPRKQSAAQSKRQRKKKAEG